MLCLPAILKDLNCVHACTCAQLCVWVWREKQIDTEATWMSLYTTHECVSEGGRVAVQSPAALLFLPTTQPPACLPGTSLWITRGLHSGRVSLQRCPLLVARVAPTMCSFSKGASGAAGVRGPYRPVTYISMPSLKVKMVVVLQLGTPWRTLLMPSYRGSFGGALTGSPCGGSSAFFFLGFSVALGGRSCFQAASTAS